MNIYLAQCITILIQTYIANTKIVKRALIGAFLFNLFTMVCYILNDDITAMYLYIITLIRSFVYIYKDEIQNKLSNWHHILPISFCIWQIFVGCFTITTSLQLLCLFAPMFVIVFMWYAKNMQWIRVGNIVNNTMWGIYSGLTGLIILMIGRIIIVGVNAYAFGKDIFNKERNIKK